LENSSRSAVGQTEKITQRLEKESTRNHESRNEITLKS
jgi:hypothetical protein